MKLKKLSLPEWLLIAAAVSEEGALSNTAAIINRIMNDYVVAMIAGQIGLATAEMVKPMMESFSSLGDLFNGDFMSVDTGAFAKAFRFNLDEEELSRLMSSMMTSSSASYSNNLINLGYQDLDDPTTISLYFKDFDAKEGSTIVTLNAEYLKTDKLVSSTIVVVAIFLPYMKRQMPLMRRRMAGAGKGGN